MAAEFTKTDLTEVNLTAKSHFVRHPLVSAAALIFSFPALPLPPSFPSVCLSSSTTGCLLGLTYDCSLTLGHSKCPADSFAIISQFVLPVTVGTFGRQVHVKKAQRSASARQVKDDRRRVSFILPERLGSPC